MYNWVGKFKFLFLSIIIVLVSVPGHAADDDPFRFGTTQWNDFSKEVELQQQKDRRNGLSYVISGSLALIGGILGATVTDDNAEKGVYTLFQTIGIASVGYGAYTWQIGGEERSVYQTLQSTRFSAAYKSHFLQAYNLHRKELERKDRSIRAVTHGLIAGLNIYNATQQKQESLRNALYFIGGVNLLACISFTFEF